MDAGLSLAMTHLIAYRYWILFPLAVLEGPMIAFVCGMLVALGYFHPLIALGILVLGDILPDAFFYILGHYGNKYAWAKRYGARIGINEARFAAASKLWHSNPGKAVFVSKFAIGLSPMLLFTAGVFAVPPTLFFRYTTIISIANYGVLMTLGYFFGSSIAQVGDVLTIIQYTAAAVIVVGAVYYFAVSRIRKQIRVE